MASTKSILTDQQFTRRQALVLMGAGVAGLAFTPGRAIASDASRLLKPIPSTDEKIPAIGMGTWRTFNVGNDQQLRLARLEVVKAFFAEGGGMIDCSPMYGSAREFMGFALGQIEDTGTLFSAEKVWTGNGGETRQQIAESQDLWRIKKFDLMQIHNLVAWQDHLETLRQMKQDGEIRYIGITTSHGRRHSDIEKILQSEDIDFLQLTYNLTHREVERRLLPLALEKNVAVIANRPYDGGSLISRLKSREAVPDWAAEELACRTWADFMLKFIVSHPAVTCAIPATSSVAHLRENMQAGRGPMPDKSQRERMIQFIESL